MIEVLLSIAMIVGIFETNCFYEPCGSGAVCVDLFYDTYQCICPNDVSGVMRMRCETDMISSTEHGSIGLSATGGGIGAELLSSTSRGATTTGGLTAHDEHTITDTATTESVDGETTNTRGYTTPATAERMVTLSSKEQSTSFDSMTTTQEMTGEINQDSSTASTIATITASAATATQTSRSNQQQQQTAEAPSSASVPASTSSPLTMGDVAVTTRARTTPITATTTITTTGVMTPQTSTGNNNRVSTTVPTTDLTVLASTPVPPHNCTADPKAHDYRGTLSTTISGRTCQSWSDVTPHLHGYTSGNSPGRGLGDHNYCRNPTADEANGFTAWCFTTDPAVVEDFCAIGSLAPECIFSSSDSSECYEDNDGADYRGTVSVTQSGFPCQRWNSQSPHTHGFIPLLFSGSGIGSHNYCRNPPPKAAMAWCYVATPGEMRWDYCNIGLRQASC